MSQNYPPAGSLINNHLLYSPWLGLIMKVLMNASQIIPDLFFTCSLVSKRVFVSYITQCAHLLLLIHPSQHPFSPRSLSLLSHYISVFDLRRYAMWHLRQQPVWCDSSVRTAGAEVLSKQRFSEINLLPLTGTQTHSISPRNRRHNPLWQRNSSSGVGIRQSHNSLHICSLKYWHSAFRWTSRRSWNKFKNSNKDLVVSESVSEVERGTAGAVEEMQATV